MMFKLIKLLKLFGCVAIFSLCTNLLASNANAQNIRVEGNLRISTETIINYLPTKGETALNSAQTADIIKALYDTGFFSNVSVDNNGGVLIIKVEERPVISSITVAGNKKITQKQFLEAIKQMGIWEGQVLNQAALNSLQQALTQQYYNLGCYSAKVNVKLTPQPRSRIAVAINIYEGPVAKIKEIRITGNQAFTTKELLKNFSLSKPQWWKFWKMFSDDDKYSKEKLDADLEKLRTFYMDRGYLQFDTDAAQASLTPDKKSIYVVVHVQEGSLYHVSGYSLQSSFKEQEMRKLIALKKGDMFSRQDVMFTNALLERFVGDYGYASPSIKSEPVIDEKNHLVFFKFTVDPGKRVYVRRISFSGNAKTDETVLRREMRQQEGSLFSLSKIDESKRRIANLGYLENVDFEIEPVPEHRDQIDLQGKAKETPSAFANFQVGYANADGLIYGISVNEQSFLGTGKEVGIQFNNSKYSRTYGFSYYNPYYTNDNISLRFSAFAQTQQPQRLDLSSYSTDVYGGSIIYGIPLSDYNRWSLGYGFEYTKLIPPADAYNRSAEINNFLKDHGNRFSEAKLIAGWSHNKLDRSIFPTEGFVQSIGLELYLPASRHSLTFYKTNYETSYYYPILHSRKWVALAHAELGYGNGIGNTHGLPFFKNYYAGGMDSVRGFDVFTLGPTDSRGLPKGGNVLTVATLGLVFPNPAGDSLRTTAFVDVGNVYDHMVKVKELRSSVGIQAEWRSPLGILRFCFAKPIRSRKTDRARFFDFSFGTSF